MAEEKQKPEEKVHEVESEPVPTAIPKEETSAFISSESPTPTPPAITPKSSFGQKLKQFWHTKKGKVITFTLALLIILGILYAVPMTRYGVLSAFVKKQVTITITDSTTKKPVSQARITLGTITANTNNKGQATLYNVPVGQYTLKITKKYYKDTSSSYELPVFGAIANPTIALQATGRQVVVNVVNKITGASVAKATVKVSDTSAITDEQGHAMLVLPADKQSLKATITSDNYNQTEADIKVDSQAMNTVALTPAGTVFYLSKQTGTINVMKSNIDGSDAKVVVQGTGSESDTETVLLAARDWKFLALSAKRDTTNVNRIYLVDAATGKLSTIDEGDATFQLVGWSNHKFVYQVNRKTDHYWDNKQQALKSYDAETGKITILDETTGVGTNNFDYQAEAMYSPYILKEKVVYIKGWTLGSNYQTTVTDKKPAIMAVNADGSGKQRVREFSMQHYATIEAKLYEPQAIYYKVSVDSGVSTFFEYEEGSLKSASSTDDKFYNTYYPTYLISPSGKNTLWYEPRDGKNTLLVGDDNAKNPSTLATGSDFTAYGWYTDDYVLLSKNDSELYIAPAKNTSTFQPLKITNYHKPALRFPGYGSGYGGI